MSAAPRDRRAPAELATHAAATAACGASARRAAAALAALLGLAAAAPRLTAQEPPPELVVGISGGYTFGRGMWALRQPVVVPVTGPLLLDTFRLARSLAPGASLWAGLTWYPGPRTGFGADVGWVAAQVRTGCSIVGTPQPDSYQQNPVACSRLQSDAYATSAIATLLTATIRGDPRRDYSPFLKVGLGFALLGHPYDGVVSHSSNATCAECVRIIIEGKDRQATWAAAIAAGVTVGGVGGYRFRFEARDVILGLPVVTAPSDPLAVEPFARSAVRPVHRFTLACGLDIVLSATHRRRY